MRHWEGMYQAGEMPWDHGEAAPPLVELLERKPASWWGAGEVLVPGCGVGHDVRALAAAGLRVVGLDLAPTALRLAGELPRAGGERYLEGDLFASEWRGLVSCSAVWEHTCFCAIEPADRPRYVAAVADVVPAGGLLAGVFYLRPEPRDDGLPGPPFGVGEEELVAHFAPAFRLEESWEPGRCYPSRAGREWVAVFRRLG